MKNVLRLGTRGSKLALIQADIVKQKCLTMNPSLSIDIIPIQTEGDINKTQPLHEIGGKGVFIKTLEEALINTHIDAAIHSVKDVTSTISESTQMISFLAPEARTDCLVSSSGKKFMSLKELPLGYSIATSSLRRKAILKNIRPDIVIKDIRGNVQTRIQNCKDGFADGVLLSTAGLLRLKRSADISLELDPIEFVPAPGQGVVGIQIRKQDHEFASLFSSIGCEYQKECHYYEHYLMSKVGLDCNYPLGVYVYLDDGIVNMKVCWASLDCTHYFSEFVQGDKSSMIAKIDILVEKIKRIL